MHNNDTPDMNQNTIENTASEQALTQCQQELEDWKGRALRLSADFDNYQRRNEKEKASWMHIAQSNVFTDLLSIIDDFDRAVDQLSKNAHHEIKAQLDGFVLIQKNLYKVLEKYGVKEITQMTTFDPEIHEGLVQVDSPDHESGAIVGVLQKGFTFKNSVLRPAKVSVAK
ncbi:hypothetical protein Noda2021_06270 [Candidatus Dependentiae bacterium Noda2021]|nr:hypothetical protein Noda2021_06270 [Candidatus Dependentiae bacterium Noda2021]